MIEKIASTPPTAPLRMARQKRGWTQKELAERIGLPSPLNVIRWERGTAIPNALYREKLCQLFGLSA